MKIVIKPSKSDEFAQSICSFSSRIRKEKGCLGHSLYRDSEKENKYLVVGEWKTRQSMERHFQTQDFEVLIGAARVLGETFTISIAEVSKNGGFELAREQIAPRKGRSADAD
jgi:quinol monooxygenase YgiN